MNKPLNRLHGRSSVGLARSAPNVRSCPAQLRELLGRWTVTGHRRRCAGVVGCFGGSRYAPWPEASAGGRRTGIKQAVVVAAVVGLSGATAGAGASTARKARVKAAAVPTFVARTLNGTSNNSANPNWGKAGTNYTRVASSDYADGIATMVAGPNARYISNRIFNDIGQNLFSENNISQWGWAWGQFLDHDMGLRDETPAEDASVPFNTSDPLESFANDTGSIEFNRTPAAPGTGVSSTRQQVNTISSYIDASNVYGVTAASRLDPQWPGRRKPVEQQR